MVAQRRRRSRRLSGDEPSTVLDDVVGVTEQRKLELEAKLAIYEADLQAIRDGYNSMDDVFRRSEGGGGSVWELALECERRLWTAEADLARCKAQIAECKLGMLRERLWQPVLRVPAVMMAMARYFHRSSEVKAFLEAIEMSGERAAVQTVGFFNELDKYAVPCLLAPDEFEFWRPYPLVRGWAYDSENEHVVHFASTLRVLNCERNGNRLTDECLQQLPLLERLDCYNNTAFTDAGLLSVAATLRVLYVNDNVAFTDNAIAQCTNLTTLSCGENEVLTDACALTLTQLTTLMCFKNALMTDAVLYSCTQLTALHCGWCENFTIDALLSLPRLVAFSCSGADDFTNAHVSRMTRLTILKINFNEQIDDDGVACLTNLTALDLSDSEHFTNAVFERLTRLRQLKFTQNRNITADGIRHLRALREIDVPEDSNIERMDDEWFDRLAPGTIVIS